jgi:hypothetical protein
MANEKDRLGNIYTPPDPRGGQPPAGTLVTVPTPNGPMPARILNGVAVLVTTGSHK